MSHSWKVLGSRMAAHSLVKHREIKSVMDVLNLWKDDPEELLLELGFGRDEPDLSGRIPARFINYQSQARGINLQVFLDAQKNRIDMEDPDVSNRFRQVEVLQHVTSTFSALVVSSSSSSSSSSQAPVGKPLSPEAWERRRRMANLFRLASKKSLSQIHQYQTTQDLTSPTDTSSFPATPESPQPSLSLGETVPEQSVKIGSLENVILCPVVEEYGGDPPLGPHIQERALRPGHLRKEGPSLTPNTFFYRKSRMQARASPDMGEVLPGGSQGNERPDSSSSPPLCNSSCPQLSPSLISSGVKKASLSSPCPLPEPSKCDTLCSEMETPPDQVKPPPASVSESALEHLPSCSSSSKLQNVTHSQSPALPALTFISLGPTSSPTHAALLLQGSEDNETEVKDAPWPYLATSFHGSKDMACSTLSSDPPLLSPTSNLDCPFPGFSAMSVLSGSSKIPKNTQSEKTEVVLHENSLLVSGFLSIGHPPSTYLPLSAPPNVQCPPSFVSLHQTESFPQSPKDISEQFVFRGSGLSEKPSNPSLQLEKDIPSAPLPPVLDFLKLEHNSPTLSILSSETFTLISPPAMSSQSHPDPNPINLSAGRILHPTEQSISQEGQSCSPDDNTDYIPSSVQNEKMCLLSMDLDNNLQEDRNEDAAVCVSDTESSGDLLEGSGLCSEELCHQTEKDPLVSAETKQKELREDWQMEINDIDSETPTSYFVVNNCPELDSRTDVESKNLMEVENLDMILETSVDGLESENGDIDAFFQQLDSEGRVYWAEPVQVSNSSYVLKESGSFESLYDSQWNSLSSRGSAALESVSLSTATGSVQNSTETVDPSDTPSSLVPAPVLSHPVTPDVKLSSCSVSIQMSSSPSSHIVHRKDVPFEADSKHTSLPSVFPLDTSSPFRAVQAWTDLQIQRNNKKLSDQAFSVPYEAAAPMGATEKTQRSTLVYSSSPSFPLMSKDSQSCDCLPATATNYRTVSISVDTGLGPDKEEEVDGNGGKEFLWGVNGSVSMNCCCSCDHRCHLCIQESYSKQHTLENTPYSLDDLEEMMLSLQQYCSMHSNMEEQLSETRASVYNALPDVDREKIEDLELLRRAVKREAEELETQLNQLAHHHDDSLKMKMRRLLDEQSLLCTQLRVFQPTSHSTPNRTVATQCCLPPWTGPADTQSDHNSSWSMTNRDSLRHSPPGSESV